ncbi:hypothetical protein ACFPYM_08015, partial [Methylobacterium hispanicum]
MPRTQTPGRAGTTRAQGADPSDPPQSRVRLFAALTHDRPISAFELGNKKQTIYKNEHKIKRMSSYKLLICTSSYFRNLLIPGLRPSPSHPFGAAPPSVSPLETPCALAARQQRRPLAA